MGSDADEWNQSAARLRELAPEERVRSPELAVLYGMAMRIAPAFLARKGIDPSSAQDFALDLLLEKLDALVEAAVPFPYFVTALRNRAFSQLRSPKTRVAAEPKLERVAVQPDENARLDLPRVWARLTARERQLFAAMDKGADRREMAAMLGISRANLDQIISRARKRLAEEGFE